MISPTRTSSPIAERASLSTPPTMALPSGRISGARATSRKRSAQRCARATRSLHSRSHFASECQAQAGPGPFFRPIMCPEYPPSSERGFQQRKRLQHQHRRRRRQSRHRHPCRYAGFKRTGQASSVRRFTKAKIASAGGLMSPPATRSSHASRGTTMLRSLSYGRAANLSVSA